MSEQYQNYVTKKSFYIVCAIATALLLALGFLMLNANNSTIDDANVSNSANSAINDNVTMLAQELVKQNPTKIILDSETAAITDSGCTEVVNAAGVLLYTYHNSGPNKWRIPCHTPH